MFILIDIDLQLSGIICLGNRVLCVLNECCLSGVHFCDLCSLEAYYALIFFFVLCAFFIYYYYYYYSPFKSSSREEL